MKILKFFGNQPNYMCAQTNTTQYRATVDNTF